MYSVLSTGILICSTRPFWSGSLCLFGFCLPVSSVPNFRPDAGGRRCSLIQVARSIALRGGAGAAFPSTLLTLPAALYGACPALGAVPALRCSTKARTRLSLRFVPSLPEGLKQAGAWRAHSPRVWRAFSPPRSQSQFLPVPVGYVRPLPSGSPAPVPSAPVGCLCPVSHRDLPGGCRPSRISGSLWLETGCLFAVW